MNDREALHETHRIVGVLKSGQDFDRRMINDQFSYMLSLIEKLQSGMLWLMLLYAVSIILFAVLYIFS